MHTVIIDGDLPYPATSGKRLRTLNLMLQLAKRHRITYIGRCHVRGKELDDARAFLGDHQIEPILIDQPLPAKKGPLFYGRLAANLLSPWPYAVTSHQCPAMRDAVQQHAKKNRVDLWQSELVSYMPALEGDLPGRRILIAHNVDTLIWRRYAETASSLPARFYLQQQARKMARFERWAFHQADGVVACSTDDAAIIRTEFRQAKVAVVENGIDRPTFEALSGPRDPRQILFLGALDYRPNLQAADALLDQIFPAVQALVPDAKLVIVGRNPPTGLCRKVEGKANITLHANVPDVRPFLRDAGVMAVPLKVGGGSRLKILEALAAGMPVVSTRLGAEGLDIVPGEHYLQAEETEMGAALAQVLQYPLPAQMQAKLGRAFVLENYDWVSLAIKLEKFWEKCVSG